MKKRGFTLIEFLAVVILLAAIIMILIPTILDIAQKWRKSTFKDSIYGIVESTKILYTESMLEGGLTENKKMSFENGKPSELSYKGEIPKGGEIELNPKGEIRLALHNKEWCAIKSFAENKITLVSYKKGDCVLVESTTPPLITLNGDPIVTVEIGGEYKELGAKAQTENGKKLEYTKEIKQDGKIVENIDTSKEGTYEITYHTNVNQKTAQITRTVTISTRPVILMTEEQKDYMNPQEIIINVSGVKPNIVTQFSYQIKKDGVIEKNETVTNLTQKIKLEKTGIYEITVSVTDNHNQKNTVTKTYKIDSIPPSVGNIMVLGTKGNNGWYTSDVTFKTIDGSDSLSGHESTKVDKEKIDKNTKGETVTIKTTDKAGNESTLKRTIKVDKTEPILTLKSKKTETIKQGKSIWTSSYFNIPKYSISGGSMTCSPVNTKTLTTGSHTISCTVMGGNGLTKTVSKNIKVE